jgi:hypothetical protein
MLNECGVVDAATGQRKFARDGGDLIIKPAMAAKHSVELARAHNPGGGRVDTRKVLDQRLHRHVKIAVNHSIEKGLEVMNISKYGTVCLRLEMKELWACYTVGNGKCSAASESRFIFRQRIFTGPERVSARNGESRLGNCAAGL